MLLKDEPLLKVYFMSAHTNPIGCRMLCNCEAVFDGKKTTDKKYDTDQKQNIKRHIMTKRNIS